MTAMFVVIFIDQWLKEKGHIPALVGLASAFLCDLPLAPRILLCSFDDRNTGNADGIQGKTRY